jgi:hypothetical protein
MFTVVYKNAQYIVKHSVLDKKSSKNFVLRPQVGTNVQLWIGAQGSSFANILNL